MDQWLPFNILIVFFCAICINYINTAQKTKYNSMDFHYFLCMSTILHVMEIFVLTKYDAHVTLNLVKAHKNLMSPKRKCNQHFPPETSKPAQVHALSYGALVRVFKSPTCSENEKIKLQRFQIPEG